MATITFDTHEFIKKLKSAGFSDEQAEALADAQKASFAQALDSALATKSDVTRIERRMDAIDAKLDKLDTKIAGDMALVKWMLALVVAAEAAPLLAQLFR